jgi:hypothetical protein
MFTEEYIRKTIKEMLVLDLIVDNAIGNIMEHNHDYVRGKPDYSSLGLEPMFTILDDKNKVDLLKIVNKIKERALYYLKSYESKSEEMYHEYQGKELSKEDLQNIVTQCDKMIEMLR